MPLTSLIVGLTVVAAVGIITTLVVVTRVKKRSRQKAKLQQNSQCEIPANRAAHQPSEWEISSSSLQCSLAKSCSKVLNRDLPKIFGSSQKQKLGEGSFGVVYKGRWRGKSVAIKVLKDGVMSVQEFMKEAETMKQLQHEKLVRLYGVVSYRPIRIVMEFMCNGSLLQYLRRGDGRKSELTGQMHMASQIATGMAYLESVKYMHRDLRAANVLVGENQVCKVADFGLARCIKDGVYKAKGKPFPIKWTAPEAILRDHFTLRSDVWSFGILLMEIITKGQEPYPGMSSRGVVEKLKLGYRMPRPQGCPGYVYDTMTRCWQENPEQRPSFSDLQGDLGLYEEYLLAA